jgi:diguanylate cyclase (GGDEF)-like protein
MADRVATALCVTDPDGSHSMDFESGVAPRLRVLAQVAMDRAAREVADNMSVLGTLLGVPGLTLDSLIADFQRLDACEAPTPPPPPGLSATVRRGLEAVRGAVSEQEAIGLLIGVVRDTPGVRSVLLVMQDAGAAMVDGPTEKRPFFLKARDLAKVAEGFAGFLQHVRDRGAGVFPRDPAHDGTFSLLKADAVLAIPVSAGRASVGVIVAPQPSARVTPEVAESLGLVAQAAGDALEALQLSRGSYLLSERIALDDLTGVLNRAPFFERLAAEVRAANRYRRPLSLAMIDVDAFKSWNDRYGHPVGDRLLRDVSKTIRDCAREGDVIGRYGGDEFIVALPGCTGEQAEAFAERVRQRVETLGTIMREACYEFLLSVSIGLASATTWPCESDVLLFRADHALYRAKARGRNRVCSDTGGGPDA